MNTIKLNEKYDIYLDNFGQIALVFDYNSVIQNVISALKLIQNEYDFDVILGVPYFAFLGEPPDNEIFQEYINNIVLNVVGVEQVLKTSYIFDKTTRTYNYFITIKLKNGEIIDVIT